MPSPQVIAVLAEALEVDEGQLTPDTELETIDTYDSAGVVAIIACVDKHLGKRVDPDALADCETVADVVTLIEEGAG